MSFCFYLVITEGRLVKSRKWSHFKEMTSLFNIGLMIKFINIDIESVYVTNAANLILSNIQSHGIPVKQSNNLDSYLK